MAVLLTVEDLPRGFDYPPEFIRTVEEGITRLEPWEILEGDPLVRRHDGLRSRFPQRHLVPFAPPRG